MTRSKWLPFGLLLAVLFAGYRLWAEESARAKPDAGPLAKMVQPQYDETGALRRPDDWSQWVFVGASIGLSYDEGEKHAEGPGYFHNVYMQPEAFAEYVRTGYFPDKTMFVMENYRPKQKEKVASVNRGGFFEGDLVGMEMAVKDVDRFDLSWGYFNFTGGKGLVDKAKPLPKAFCWDCHAEQADDDNVFTQFYPVIRRARAKQTALVK